MTARHITWTLIGDWVTNCEYHSGREFAVHAGVEHHIVERCLQRGLAVAPP